MYFYVKPPICDNEKNEISYDTSFFHLLHIPIDKNINVNDNVILENYKKNIAIYYSDICNFLIYLTDVGILNEHNSEYVKNIYTTNMEYMKRGGARYLFKSYGFDYIKRGEITHPTPEISLLNNLFTDIFDNNPDIDIIFFISPYNMVSSYARYNVFPNPEKISNIIYEHIDIFIHYLNMKEKNILYNKYEKNVKNYNLALKFYFDKMFFKFCNKIDIYKITCLDYLKNPFIKIYEKEYSISKNIQSIGNNNLNFNNILSFSAVNKTNKYNKIVSMGEHNIRKLLNKISDVKGKNVEEIYNLLFKLKNNGWSLKSFGGSGSLFLEYKDKIYAETFLYGGNLFELPEEFKNVIYVSDIHLSFDSSEIRGVRAIGTNPHLHSGNLCIGDLQGKRLDNILLLCDNLKIINYSSMYECGWADILEIMTSGNIPLRALRRLFIFGSRRDLEMVSDAITNFNFDMSTLVYKEEFLPYSKLAIEKYRGYFNQLLVNGEINGTIFTLE